MTKDGAAASVILIRNGDDGAVVILCHVIGQVSRNRPRTDHKCQATRRTCRPNKLSQKLNGDGIQHRALANDDEYSYLFHPTLPRLATKRRIPACCSHHIFAAASITVRRPTNNNNGPFD